MTSQNIWRNTNSSVVRPGWRCGKSALLQGLRKLQQLVPRGPGEKKGKAAEAGGAPGRQVMLPGEGDPGLGAGGSPPDLTGTRALRHHHPHLPTEHVVVTRK